MPVPNITGASPTNLSSFGGTQVSIFGSNFNSPPVTQVTIGGNQVQSFLIDDNTHIECIAPAHAAVINVPIVVTSPTASGGGPSNAYNINYVAGNPNVSSLSPGYSPTSGGSQVAVTGTNFINVVNVNFGTVASPSFSVVSDTQISAQIPPGVAGQVNLTVVTFSNGVQTTSNPSAFNYISYPPTLQSIDPTQGPQSGGTSVDLYGTNFTNDCQVLFGTSPALSVVFNSSTWLTAVSPSHSPAEAVSVKVKNSVGTSNSQTFTYQ